MINRRFATMTVNVIVPKADVFVLVVLFQTMIGRMLMCWLAPLKAVLYPTAHASVFW